MTRSAATRDTETVSLVDGLANEIRRRILRGEIPINSWLRQDSLARDFGVSRTPVREALQKLQVSGLIQLVPNRGALVQGVTPRQIRETYQVRAELEGLSAGLAAERIEPLQLARLRAVQDGYRTAIEDLAGAPQGREIPSDGREPWLRGDLLFHETILDVAGNARLAEMVAALQMTFPATLTWGAASEVPRRLSRSLDEHENVIAALADGDPQKARRAMTQHVLRGGERVADWFERLSRP